MAGGFLALRGCAAPDAPGHGEPMAARRRQPSPTPEPVEQPVEVVLRGASPKGEDVVVGMDSLPAWWHKRAPRKRGHRPAPPPA
jgi:hypothetical protein